jgi:hypothetical protein
MLTCPVQVPLGGGAARAASIPCPQLVLLHRHVATSLCAWYVAVPWPKVATMLRCFIEAMWATSLAQASENEHTRGTSHVTLL